VQCALAIMRKRNPELTANLASNPLPASFDVVPKRGEDTEAIAISIQKSQLPAVDAVRYGKEVSQRILQIARGIQVVFTSCHPPRPRRSSSRTRFALHLRAGEMRS
jgi:cell division protein FtsX